MSAPEFSRLLALDALRDGACERVLEASAEECAGLARRFDLLAVESLSATVKVTRNSVGEVTVQGRLQARVCQSCVVTLASVAAAVDESFDLRFAFGDETDGVDVVIGADDPEPLPDGSVDLDEIVAQQLALGLDPYPRAAGVVLDADSAPDAAKDRHRDGPFAALAALRAAAEPKP